MAPTRLDSCCCGIIQECTEYLTSSLQVCNQLKTHGILTSRQGRGLGFLACLSWSSADCLLLFFLAKRSCSVSSLLSAIALAKSGFQAWLNADEKRASLVVREPLSWTVSRSGWGPRQTGAAVAPLWRHEARFSGSAPRQSLDLTTRSHNPQHTQMARHMCLGKTRPLGMVD